MKALLCISGERQVQDMPAEARLWNCDRPAEVATMQRATERQGCMSAGLQAGMSCHLGTLGAAYDRPQTEDMIQLAVEESLCLQQNTVLCMLV